MEAAAESVRRDFIYRAIEAGWTVCKVSPTSYKFTRPHNGQLEEFTAGGFLETFVQQCLANMQALWGGTGSSPQPP